MAPLVLVARLRLIQLSETARVTPVIQNAEFRRRWKSYVEMISSVNLIDTKITKICGCLHVGLLLLQALRFGGAMPRLQARGESNRGVKGLHSKYCFVLSCVFSKV